MRSRPNHAGWHLLPEVLARLGYFASAETTAARRPTRPSHRRKLRSGARAARPAAQGFSQGARPAAADRLRDKLAQRVDTADLRLGAHPRLLPADRPRGLHPDQSEGPRARGHRSRRARSTRRSARSSRRRSSELVDPDDRPARGARGPASPTRRSPAGGALTCRTSSCCGTRGADHGARLRRGSARSRRLARPAARDPCRARLRADRAGPGIQAGQSLTRAHIFDLAPTILDRLGVASPEHMSRPGVARGDGC